MSQGFVRASSENLPVVDLDMLIDFISKNELYQSAEMRGVKTARLVKQ